MHDLKIRNHTTACEYLFKNKALIYILTLIILIYSYLYLYIIDILQMFEQLSEI